MHLDHRMFIYDQVADMMLDISDYKNAELVVKDTMKLALQLGMAEDDEAMIEMYLKLESFICTLGEWILARKVFVTVSLNRKRSWGLNKKEEEVDRNVAKDTKSALEKEQNTKHKSVIVETTQAVWCNCQDCRSCDNPVQ
ncbi:hypothetical protein DPMN_145362 [Dreissena polymorpha]|uniref:Uncharacterized protein n=1 Tax=Dreissena polymorpha TaxID=45954 RepID=A0A9D4IXF2_DREPO|nr:hypothetical protein DPMN_145362 [Dreissena polymorpha]